MVENNLLLPFFFPLWSFIWYTPTLNFPDLKQIPNDLFWTSHSLFCLEKKLLLRRYQHRAAIKIPDPFHALCLDLASARMSTVKSERITEERTYFNLKILLARAKQKSRKIQQESLRLLLALILSVPYSLVQICFAALKRHLDRQIGFYGKGLV